MADNPVPLELDPQINELVNQGVAQKFKDFCEQVLKKYLPRSEESSQSFVNLERLNQLCLEQPASYIVEGLFPAEDVHGACGDSGLGKTPWAYQLGLCVA